MVIHMSGSDMISNELDSVLSKSKFEQTKNVPKTLCNRKKQQPQNNQLSHHMPDMKPPSAQNILNT